MERDGWDYDDLDEDYYYEEDNSGNYHSECNRMVSERECKAVQKRQTKKGD